MNLTDEHEQILAQITEARAREQATIKQFEAALRAQLKALKEGEGYKETHALMRQAYAMGIPKRRIGFAYGTKDPGTVNRILDVPSAAYNFTNSTATAPTAPAPSFTPEEDSVEVTLLQPTDEDYPEFLRNVENPARAAKIWVSLQNLTPFGKIGGLVAVVDLDHKIAYTTEPTPLTNLFESDRATWPAAFETALAPHLDLDLTL